ncbi:MAG: LysR family transcriptional regulator [Chloroflexi bacterium]|nr:LysR family transcriptional regulator [Chloroflexota bacterium]
MTLNQLFYFCAVARTGSYARAAEELDVSEPVVHRALRTLQKSSGLKLFECVGRRVCLTKSGSAVHAYATQIVSLAEMTNQTFEEERGPISGEISIGAGHNVGLHLLPHILQKWMLEHPRVNINVTISEGREMRTLLFHDRLDLILTSSTENAPGLRRQLVFADALLPVAAPSHPLATSSSISLIDLSKERAILSPMPSAIRKRIGVVEDQYGVRLRKVMEVSNQDAIREFCKAGVGIAILPRATVADDIINSKLVYLNVEGFPQTHPYFLVHRTGRILTQEMRLLLVAIKQWISESNRGWQPLSTNVSFLPS